MRINGFVYKELSSNWAKQLLPFVNPDSKAYERLQAIIENDKELINIKNLELCEKNYIVG